MGFDGFPEEALLFYEGLEADNSKAYWTDHRHQYEEAVRSPMRPARRAGAGVRSGARVPAVPRRPVQPGQEPYKTAVGAIADGGGYVQLSAQGLLVAAGYHQTASDQVERLRRAVADDRSGPELQRLLRRLTDGGYQT